MGSVGGDMEGDVIGKDEGVDILGVVVVGVLLEKVGALSVIGDWGDAGESETFGDSGDFDDRGVKGERDFVESGDLGEDGDFGVSGDFGESETTDTDASSVTVAG